jgi:hypothetical protein
VRRPLTLAAIALAALLLASCGGKGNSPAPPPQSAGTEGAVSATPSASLPKETGAEPFVPVSAPPSGTGGSSVVPRVTAIRIVPPSGRSGGSIGLEAQGYSPEGRSIEFEVVWAKNGEAAGAGPTFPGTLRRGDKVVVTVRPFDGKRYGPSVSLTREIGNLPPEVADPADVRFDNSTWSARIPASDPDGDALAFRLKEGPPGMTVDGSGTVRWTVPAAFSGKAPATVVVSDGKGGETSVPFGAVIRND